MSGYVFVVSVREFNENKFAGTRVLRAFDSSEKAKEYINRAFRQIKNLYHGATIETLDNVIYEIHYSWVDGDMIDCYEISKLPIE